MRQTNQVTSPPDRPLNGCQIELTNVCTRQCANCSRLTRHTRSDQRFFLSLEQLAAAIDSLTDMEGLIGIIGGEPTLHPRFPEVCELLTSKNPRERYGLWTNGANALKYESLIAKTFGYVHVNTHKLLGLHHPFTVAIEEVVPDDSLRRQLISNCWVRRTWGPSIGPKGAFFCEIASTWDRILDGPGGFPVEPRWWQRTQEEIDRQLEPFCGKCGMAIPLPGEPQDYPSELMSQGTLRRFQEHGLRGIGAGEVRLFEKRLTELDLAANRLRWQPNQFRSPEFNFWVGELRASLHTREWPRIRLAMKGMALKPVSIINHKLWRIRFLVWQYLMSLRPRK